MNKFDEILNSSDASDALLGEQIDKFTMERDASKTTDINECLFSVTNGIVVIQCEKPTNITNGDVQVRITLPDNLKLKNVRYVRSTAVLVDSSYQLVDTVVFAFIEPDGTQIRFETLSNITGQYRIRGSLVFPYDWLE